MSALVKRKKEKEMKVLLVSERDEDKDSGGLFEGCWFSTLFTVSLIGFN